jgi:hypothetical protein
MPESYSGSFTNNSESEEETSVLRGQLQALKQSLEFVLVTGLNAALIKSQNAAEDLELCGQSAQTALATYTFAAPILESPEIRTAETLNFSEVGLLRSRIQQFKQALQAIITRVTQTAGHPPSVVQFDLQFCSDVARKVLDFKSVDSPSTFGGPAIPGN